MEKKKIWIDKIKRGHTSIKDEDHPSRPNEIITSKMM